MSHQSFVMPLQQDPPGDTSNNQNARCDCEQCALFAEFMGFSEFRKVAIAGAARTEMIEPLFSLGERHRSRRNFLKHVSARASGTLRIRKFLEQTSAQRSARNTTSPGRRLATTPGFMRALQNTRPRPSASMTRLSSLAEYPFSFRLASLCESCPLHRKYTSS